MDKGLISIIIPIYNGEKWLTNAIESAINQSYDNIEIICVDDGSTDNSYKLCQSYQGNSKVILYHKENGGQASARNYGLKVAKGDFIQFLDCDDTLEQEACLLAVEQMTGGIDFVMYGFNIYSNKSLLRTPHCSEMLYDGEYKDFKELSKLLASPCNKLYRREYIREYFNEGCVYGEDGIFNYENLTNKTKIKVIENCLYNVNLDNPNSVNKVYKPGRINDTVRSILIRYTKITELFGALVVNKDYLPQALVTICFTVLLGGGKSSSYKAFRSEMEPVYIKSDFFKLVCMHNVNGIGMRHKIVLFLIRQKALILLYSLSRILFKIRA